MKPYKVQVFSPCGSNAIGKQEGEEKEEKEYCHQINNGTQTEQRDFLFLQTAKRSNIRLEVRLKDQTTQTYLEKVPRFMTKKPGVLSFRTPQSLEGGQVPEFVFIDPCTKKKFRYSQGKREKTPPKTVPSQRFLDRPKTKPSSPVVPSVCTYPKPIKRKPPKVVEEPIVEEPIVEEPVKEVVEEPVKEEIPKKRPYKCECIYSCTETGRSGGSSYQQEKSSNSNIEVKRAAISSQAYIQNHSFTYQTPKMVVFKHSPSHRKVVATHNYLKHQKKKKPEHKHEPIISETKDSSVLFSRERNNNRENTENVKFNRPTIKPCQAPSPWQTNPFLNKGEFISMSVNEIRVDGQKEPPENVARQKRTRENCLTLKFAQNNMAKNNGRKHYSKKGKGVQTKVRTREDDVQETLSLTANKDSADRGPAFVDYSRKKRRESLRNNKAQKSTHRRRSTNRNNERDSDTPEKENLKNMRPSVVSFAPEISASSNNKEDRTKGNYNSSRWKRDSLQRKRARCKHSTECQEMTGALNVFRASKSPAAYTEKPTAQKRPYSDHDKPDKYRKHAKASVKYV